MKTMKRKKRLLGIIAWIPSACMVLLFASCGGSATDTGAVNEQSPAAQKTYDAQPKKVVGLAKIEPEGKTVQLYAQVNGTIEQVATKLGDQVTAAQVLFVVEHKSEDGKIEKIKTQIREQEAAVKGAAANLEKAKGIALNTEKNYQRIRQVYAEGADTKANLDNAESTWQSARADVEAMAASLESAEGRLAELRSDLRLATIERDKYFVKAPANGTILQVDGVLGATVGPAVSLANFAAESPTDAVAEIDELFADLVRLNQPAYIRKQGASDSIATGIVIAVAPALRQKSLFSEEIGKLEDRRVREVRVRLLSGQEKVLYGQRVECVIDVKTIE